MSERVIVVGTRVHYEGWPDVDKSDPDEVARNTGTVTAIHDDGYAAVKYDLGETVDEWIDDLVLA